MVGIASLELPNGGVLGHCCTIQLQPGVPSWMAHVSCVFSLPTIHRGGPPLVLSYLLLFGLLLGDHLPLLNGLILFSLLFIFGIGSRPTVEGGGGGGRAGGS